MKDQAQDLKTEFHSAFREKFRLILSDPKNDYFRKIAASAYAQQNTPTCKSGSKSYNQAQCTKSLSEKLGEHALREVFREQDLDRVLSSYFGGSYVGGDYGLDASFEDMEFVTKNPAYKNTVSALRDQVKARIVKPKVENKIQQDIFPQVKEMLIKKIQENVQNENTKAMMVERVRGIQWDGTSCADLYGSDVKGMLTPNAFYNPKANTFKICSGMLYSGDSAFDIVDAMAHELSHSIDPCEISKGPSAFRFNYPKNATQKQAEEAYPIKGVIQCLRQPSSVNAKHFTFDDYDSPFGYRNSDKHGGGLGWPEYKNKKVYRPGPRKNYSQNDPFAGFCKRDQIGESFADWMAAEILPDYIEKGYKLTPEQYREGYANTWRTACTPAHLEVETRQPIDVHPELRKRINKILLVNPKIRQQMGCKTLTLPGAKYCGKSQPVSAPSSPSGDAKGVR